MAIPFKKYGYQINPITDEIETPKIFLVDKKLNKLGQLYPVDNLHITLNEANQADEISFTYYKQTDGVDCPCFEQLDDLFVIQVEKFGFFEVAVNKEDSTAIQKSVSGISLGIAELSQILTSVEINTDDDMNRDDYDADYPTVFYREIEDTDSSKIAEKKREFSLLHRILKRAPHYKIGKVSNTIQYVQRTFSWSDQDIISIFNDIAQEINCMFDIHVNINEDGQVERIINVYDVQYCYGCFNKLNDAQKKVSSNVSQFRNIIGGVCQHCGKSDFIYDIGENTNIFISTDNLSDDITIECDKDSIKNSFKIVGGDDLITNTVTGLSMSSSDRIVQFSDYQKEQMSDDLRTAYENYIADYNRNKQNYASLLETQYNLYDMILYLQSGKMPLLEEEITTPDEALYSIIEKIFTYYNNTFYISQWSYYDKSFNASYNSVRNMFTTFLPKGYFFTVDEDDKVVTENYDPDVYYLWYGTIKLYPTNNSDDYYELHITKSGNSITYGKNKNDYYFSDRSKQEIINRFRVMFEFGDKSQESYMEYIRQHVAYIMSTEVDLTYDNEKARHWEEYGLEPLKNYYSGFSSCIESLTAVINEDKNANEAKNLLQKMEDTYKKIQSDISRQIKVLEQQIFALCYYLGDFSSATNYINEDGTISSQFQSLIPKIPEILANMNNSSHKGGYKKNIAGLTTVENEYVVNEYVGEKPIKCRSCNSSNVSMTASGAICNCGSHQIYTYADMMGDIIQEYKKTNKQTVTELRQEYQNRFNIQNYINAYESEHHINTNELYNELCSFIREDVYSNSNYISDGLTNAQLIDETRSLITKAQQELAKACVPKYTITAPLCSIVAQTAFEYKGVLVNDDYSKFMINNYVHVKIDKDIYTMRISSIDLEFPISDKISVTFTNATKGTGITNDIASIISNASDMATSFSSVATQAEKGNQANSTFETIKNEGINAALMSVKGGGTEQDVTIDEHGILLRRKIFETGEYSDYQMKLINRNIVLTDNNWKDAKMAIGYGLYNNNPVYGIWADLLVGDLTITKELQVINDKGTVIIDENGITLDGGAITWKNKGITDTIKVYYAVSSDGKTHPAEASSDWKEEFTGELNNNYLWSKTVTTDTLNNKSVVYNCLGKSQNGIKSTKKQYYLSTSDISATGGQWIDNQPTWAGSGYIWTRTHTEYISGSTEDTNVAYDEGLTRSLKDFTNFNQKVVTALGLGNPTTEIGEDYVISPKIGGGYLCIANDTYSVEIDPNHMGDNKTKDGYLFCIRNKISRKTIMGVDTDGKGYFKGQIIATSGKIGNWNIKTDGWLTADGSAGISWDSSDGKTHFSVNGDNLEMGRIEENNPKIRMNAFEDSTNNPNSNCFTTDVGYISLKSKGNIILESNENIKLEANGYIEIIGSQNEYFNIWCTTKFYRGLRLYATNTDYAELGATCLDNTASGAYLLAKSSMAVSHQLQVGTGLSDQVWTGLDDYKLYVRGSSYVTGTSYTNSGTTVTSDKNKKNSISVPSDHYVELFDAMNFRKFKYNDGTSDRYHLGVIAQEVEEVMNKTGISSQDFGGLVIDEQGNYFVRYDEINVLTALKVKQLEKKIKHLEDKLNDLATK